MVIKNILLNESDRFKDPLKKYKRTYIQGANTHTNPAIPYINAASNINE